MDDDEDDSKIHLGHCLRMHKGFVWNLGVVFDTIKQNFQTPWDRSQFCSFIHSCNSSRACCVVNSSLDKMGKRYFYGNSKIRHWVHLVKRRLCIKCLQNLVACWVSLWLNFYTTGNGNGQRRLHFTVPCACLCLLPSLDGIEPPQDQTTVNPLLAFVGNFKTQRRTILYTQQKEKERQNSISLDQFKTWRPAETKSGHELIPSMSRRGKVRVKHLGFQVRDRQCRLW